ncbi:peptidoglycan editing factor PgeF [Methylococcus sp. EFPC2]|uniref:peptidoglycan editing factor PgeF n=1 Tax=Methylococcus sp. EFPC2 TaxID=2812648 RepID=UPI0019671326|nr:peptidoglycan editing factor PgeF [Methylococcus sp. EFPC2]QSA96296.1 peptidoglycan editing factor PgeF [Methylococcus sp. EFPC2]
MTTENHPPLGSPGWIVPDWPAPAHVRAASSLRKGGASRGEFAGLNLGTHVGDDPERVASNRKLLSQALDLPAEPLWLNQVHGTTAVRADAPATVIADASWTDRPATVCAVMTADCLPILLCDRRGERIAAVHAGWRGLADGVVEATVDALGTTDLLAWLGPAIGSDAFEVGDEVRRTFIDRLGECEHAFRPHADKWKADLYTLARLVLGGLGIDDIHGGGHCTYGDPDRFYSYRRDGRTGRMATLIWKY